MSLLHLAEGSIFAGDYRVVRLLAEGGMGAVYECRQVTTGASRALKIMHPNLIGDEKLRGRFIQEAKVGALIESDHVVQVVGAGVETQSGIPWLAMELLKGETLAAYMARKGSLSPWEVRDVFSQLCHALAAAHAVGVVHRDLKPENIFLSVPRREGVSFTVKVLDFGIAKLLADLHTHHTAAIGTPLWMAPEQTEVGMPVTPATDVWALGLLAFYAFTGFHFWRVANAERLSAAALLREVVLEDIVAASERATLYNKRDRIPPGFDAWFARCVVREMDRRFSDAHAARESLEAVIEFNFPDPSRPSTTRRPALVVTPTSPPDSNIESSRTELDFLERGETLLVAQTPDGRPAERSVPPPKVISVRPVGQSPSASTDEYNVLVPPHTGDLGTTTFPSDPPDVTGEIPVVRPIPRSLFFVAGAAALLLAVWVGARLMRAPPADPAFAVPHIAAKPSVSSSPSLSAAPTKACPAGMAFVPGGTLFGKNDPMSIAPFCIDAREVSVASYEACAKKGTCTTEGLTAASMCNYGSKGKEKHPINCVDWDQSAAYCAAQGKRLPTTSEWEWAARDTDTGSTYPWGEDAPADHLCWSGVLKRSGLGTCEIGAHPSGSGRLGVLDLAGNVSEWAAADGSEHESVRPLLGDHWKSDRSVFTKDGSGKASVGARIGARRLHDDTVGFRCALTP